MFSFFKRGNKISGWVPSLDSVHFDTTGLKSDGQPEDGKLRVWYTPDGDGVGLFFFDFPPDLPAGVASIQEFADRRRRALASSDGRLVYLDVLKLGNCPLLRAIVSLPQNPTGRTYISSITLPFRDFSYVIKCQSEERGVTGMRESTLLNRKLAEGIQSEIIDGRLNIPDWNPDSEEFDHEFPNHPVSRARRVLAQLTRGVVLDERMLSLPIFELPYGQA